MRRLLQGDVGSGKTVVALYCLVRAAEAGCQGALMAPTETLAAQHAETAARLVGALAPAELLTASLTRQGAPRGAGSASRSGEARLVIGTHALLQERRALRRPRAAGRRRAAPLRRRAARRHIRPVSFYEVQNFMIIDEVTKKNLELTQSLFDQGRKSSLFGC